MPEPPSVSVLMPAYDAEATLGRAVSSVLAQTRPDVEVIVVDDGSRVPAASVLAGVRDERLRVLRHAANRGLSAARNTALAAARGPLVAQLDADDAWEPDYVERVLPRFDDAGVGLVYANARVISRDREWLYVEDAAEHPVDDIARLVRSCPIPNPTVTMRAAAVRAAGGYAGWLWSTQDWHLYCKLALAGWRFAYVDAPLARYRAPDSDGSMSFHVARVKRDMLKMWGGLALRHPLTAKAHRPAAAAVAREVRRRLRGAGPLPPEGGLAPDR